MRDRVYLIKSDEDYVDRFLSEVYSENWKGRRDYVKIKESMGMPIKYPCVIETEDILSADFDDGDYGGIWSEYLTIFTITYK